MRYSEALDVFFRDASGGATPRTATDATPSRRLRDAIEPLAMLSVWSPEAHERYEPLGLDFLSGYVFGRAAPLGVVPTPVVVGAFGVFAPAVVGSAYETGMASCSHADVLAARSDGAIAAYHRILGAPDREVELVVSALRRGLERAEPTGRALFAGHSALDWPGDAWGRLWHATTLLREYRGDGHLAGCVSAGLDAVGMNLLTEAHVGLADRSYTASRGWTEAEIEASATHLADRGLLDWDGVPTGPGRMVRDAIESATEESISTVVDEIGGEIGGLDAVIARCAGWSDAVVAAGAFPPDPFKRAAG